MVPLGTPSPLRLAPLVEKPSWKRTALTHAAILGTGLFLGDDLHGGQVSGLARDANTLLKYRVPAPGLVKKYWSDDPTLAALVGTGAYFGIPTATCAAVGLTATLARYPGKYMSDRREMKEAIAEGYTFKPDPYPSIVENTVGAGKFGFECARHPWDTATSAVKGTLGYVKSWMPKNAGPKHEGLERVGTPDPLLEGQTGHEQ